MLKTAGLVCIVLSCSAAGIYLSNMKKKTIRYVEGVLYLIRHIKYKITYFRSEIDKIYEDFTSQFLENTGFLEELKKTGVQAAFVKYNSEFNVREYEANAINNLAMALGRSSWEDQSDKCTFVIVLLEKYLEELNLKYPEERKFIASLGVISGLLVAVVLF